MQDFFRIIIAATSEIYLYLGRQLVLAAKQAIQ
jgi:hypothetical protein